MKIVLLDTATLGEDLDLSLFDAYGHVTVYPTSRPEELGARVKDAEVLAALRLLTHDDEEPYDSYIARIAISPLARQVKLADLRHNSDLSRLSPTQIDEWALRRNEKYRQAIKLLTEE